MNSHYQQLARELLQITLAIDNDVLGAQEAIDRLEATAAANCDLTGITEIWQVTQKSNDVLRILYPDYGEILGSEDLRIPSMKDDIPLEVSTKIMICQILCGVQTLDKDPNRIQGAVELLGAYPSPVPKPDSPFVDGKGIWDHTHGSADEL